MKKQLKKTLLIIMFAFFVLIFSNNKSKAITVRITKFRSEEGESYSHQTNGNDIALGFCGGGTFMANINGEEIEGHCMQDWTNPPVKGSSTEYSRVVCKSIGRWAYKYPSGGYRTEKAVVKYIGADDLATDISMQKPRYLFTANQAFNECKSDNWWFYGGFAHGYTKTATGILTHYMGHSSVIDYYKRSAIQEALDKFDVVTGNNEDDDVEYPKYIVRTEDYSYTPEGSTEEISGKETIIEVIYKDRNGFKFIISIGISPLFDESVNTNHWWYAYEYLLETEGYSQEGRSILAAYKYYYDNYGTEEEKADWLLNGYKVDTEAPLYGEELEGYDYENNSLKKRYTPYCGMLYKDLGEKLLKDAISGKTPKEQVQVLDNSLLTVDPGKPVWDNATDEITFEKKDANYENSSHEKFVINPSVDDSNFDFYENGAYIQVGNFNNGTFRYNAYTNMTADVGSYYVPKTKEVLPSDLDESDENFVKEIIYEEEIDENGNIKYTNTVKKYIVYEHDENGNNIFEQVGGTGSSNTEELFQGIDFSKTNIKITNQHGDDITDECYILAIGKEAGNATAQKISIKQLNQLKNQEDGSRNLEAEELFTKILDTNFCYLIPNNGINGAVKITGQISHKLNYYECTMYYLEHGTLQNCGVSATSLNVIKTADVTLDITSEVYDFTSGNITFYKQVENPQTEGESIALEGVYFKLRNTQVKNGTYDTEHPESYNNYVVATNHNASEKANFLKQNGTNTILECDWHANGSEQDATIFRTDSEGKIEIKNLIRGKYELVEVGNENYGYSTKVRYLIKGTSQNDLIITSKNAVFPNLTIIGYNKQEKVAIYGRVWEDKASGKLSERNNTYDPADDVINGVTVRLKLDGLPVKDTQNYMIYGNGNYTIESGYQAINQKEGVTLIEDKDNKSGAIVDNKIVPVTLRNTMKTGEYFWDVRDDGLKDIEAKYIHRDGQFGFVNLDLELLKAGRYSIEFEYDGIIYDEVDAATFLNNLETHNTSDKDLTETQLNTYINEWNEKLNLSKAVESDYSNKTVVVDKNKDTKGYEYDVDRMYTIRSRLQFNEDFHTTEKGTTNTNSYFTNATIDDTTLSQLIEQGEDLHDEEKYMEYTEKRYRVKENVEEEHNYSEVNESTYSYLDLAYNNNLYYGREENGGVIALKDDTYGITAQTNVDFCKLIRQGKDEYISEVNLGIYRREEPALSLNSGLKQVQVIVNGYSHYYNYHTEESDIIDFQNEFTFKYEGKVNSQDAKYDLSDINSLQVYATYSVDITNNNTDNIYIAVDELTNYHNSELEINKIAVVPYEIETFAIAAGKVDKLTTDSEYIRSFEDDNLTTQRIQNSIRLAEPMNGQYTNMSEDKITINNTNHVSIGEAMQHNFFNKEGEDLGLIAPGETVRVYVQYKLSKDKILELAEQDVGSILYLHTLFEVNKYSVYSKENNEIVPYAGVLTNACPHNTNLSLNRMELNYKESDTTYSPLFRLVFGDSQNTRNGTGVVFEDNSVFDSQTIDKSGTVENNEDYKKAILARAKIENDTTQADGDQYLASYKTRNGNGILDEGETGIGNVSVMYQSLTDINLNEEARLNENYEGQEHKIKVNYLTKTVEEDGNYNFDIYLIDLDQLSESFTIPDGYGGSISYYDILAMMYMQGEFEHQAQNTPDNLLKVYNYIETNLIEQAIQDMEDGYIYSDAVSKVMKNPRTGQWNFNLKDNMIVYYKPVKDGTGTYYYDFVNLNKGQYYIPDLIANSYCVNYYWGDEQRAISGNQLYDYYQPDVFKSTIKHEEKETASAMLDNEDQTRYNDASDIFTLRKEYDNRLGQSQDSKYEERDLYDYQEYPKSMIATTIPFELKVESAENITDDKFYNEPIKLDNITYPYGETVENAVDQTIYQYNPIDFGLTLRAKNALSIMKYQESFSLIAQSGEVLVTYQTKVDNSGNLKFEKSQDCLTSVYQLERIDRRGNRYNKIDNLIQLDKELRENSILSVNYRIAILNISEIDYMLEDYYKYGDCKVDASNDPIALMPQDIYELPTNNYTKVAYLNGEDTSEAIGLSDSLENEATDGKEWILMSKDSYTNEKKSNDPTKIKTTNEYGLGSNRLIHIGEITSTETVVKNADVQNNNETTFKYSEGDLWTYYGTKTADIEEWRKDLIKGYRAQETSNDDIPRQYYKAVYGINPLTRPLEPGQSSTQMFITQTTIKDTNTSSTYLNEVELGTAWAGVKIGEDFTYYGSKLFTGIAFTTATTGKINIINPTGGNKNYSTYILAAIGALIGLASGIVVIVILNKKKL